MEDELQAGLLVKEAKCYQSQSLRLVKKRKGEIWGGKPKDFQLLRFF